MKRIDMKGRRFGRLVVVRYAGRDKWGKSTWHCRCECGGSTVTQRTDLTLGKAQSCGCSRIERPPNFRHGHSRVGTYTATYRSWQMMWTRCTNPHVPNYSRYGGRGIKVCKRWRLFEHFLADMGERPKNTTLDRINPNGNYTPSNCRWATPYEQTHNRRK